MRLLFPAGGLALLAVTLFLAGLGVREGLAFPKWLYVASFGVAALGGLVPRLRKAIYLAAALFLAALTISYFSGITGA
ncbi:MAG: hypothetical protein U0174_21180 [Polyangiaceae bacterium]